MKKGLTIHGFVAVVAATVIAFTSAVASQPVISKNPSIDWKKAEANYIVALNSDNLGIRQSAATYVAEYQLKGAVEPLIQLLKSDKVESMRMAAALALVSFDNGTARAAVEEAALYDGSDKVSKFCQSLLEASPNKFSALE
jgi:HEAT repeat protein